MKNKVVVELNGMKTPVGIPQGSFFIYGTAKSGLV